MAQWKCLQQQTLQQQQQQKQSPPDCSHEHNDYQRPIHNTVLGTTHGNDSLNYSNNSYADPLVAVDIIDSGKGIDYTHSLGGNAHVRGTFMSSTAVVDGTVSSNSGNDVMSVSKGNNFPRNKATAVAATGGEGKGGVSGGSSSAAGGDNMVYSHVHGYRIKMQAMAAPNTDSNTDVNTDGAMVEPYRKILAELSANVSIRVCLW
jgi:hypothetical protein